MIIEAASSEASLGNRANEPAPIVAVLVPCHNEGSTVSKVVTDFRRNLPQAQIFVYDNNSTDDTVRKAREAGAIVRSETLQGKGNVVRRMFADVEADIYVLVDGDDTYDADSAPRLIELMLDGGYDMVTAVRDSVSRAAYRIGHRSGNKLFTGIVAWAFGNQCNDMLSGYRVFSRRFVKSFPGLSNGFEIETELTVHALELRAPMGELRTPYGERPAGSSSKLSTIRDGIRILWMIIVLLKEERPLHFFLSFAAIFAAASLVLAFPVFSTYLEQGIVPRLPTATLSMGLMLLAFLSLTCGLVQDTVTRGRREMKRFHYLSVPAPFRRHSQPPVVETVRPPVPMMVPHNEEASKVAIA